MIIIKKTKTEKDMLLGLQMLIMNQKTNDSHSEIKEVINNPDVKSA